MPLVWSPTVPFFFHFCRVLCSELTKLISSFSFFYSAVFVIVDQLIKVSFLHFTNESLAFTFGKIVPLLSCVCYCNIHLIVVQAMFISANNPC